MSERERVSAGADETAARNKEKVSEMERSMERVVG
jgi:hypothetical protein